MVDPVFEKGFREGFKFAREEEAKRLAAEDESEAIAQRIGEARMKAAWRKAAEERDRHPLASENDL